MLKSDQQPRISAVAAIGRNRELGKNGTLIWKTRDDMRRLRALTTGHPIIMGRKTHESIGTPLPNRTNIIITKNTNAHADGCVVVHSLEKAFQEAKQIETDEIFIFGGAQIYTAALSQTDRLYLTLFDVEDRMADAFFPDYSAFTKIIQKEQGRCGDLTYTYATLER